MSESMIELARSVGVDIASLRGDSDAFMSGFCKIDERLRALDGLPNPVEKYIEEHHGKIDESFIPVEYFYDGCFMPESEAWTMTLKYGWRYGGVVVDFDPVVFSAMMEGEPLTSVPRTWIDMIPGWTVSVPIRCPDPEGGVMNVTHYFGRRKYNGNDCLITYYFGKRIVGDIYDIVDDGDGFVKFVQADTGIAMTDAQANVLAACLYTFTMVPHNPISREYRLVNKKNRKPHYHIEPRSKPKVVSYAQVQQNYVENYGDSTNARMCDSRKAHMRRGHWRSSWVGPRNGKQTKVLNWIPPTFVRGSKAK